MYLARFSAMKTWAFLARSLVTQTVSLYSSQVICPCFLSSTLWRLLWHCDFLSQAPSQVFLLCFPFSAPFFFFSILSSYLWSEEQISLWYLQEKQYLASSLFGISIGNITSSHVSMIFPLTLTSEWLPLIGLRWEEASYSLPALCVCFLFSFFFKWFGRWTGRKKLTISWLVFVQLGN